MGYGNFNRSSSHGTRLEGSKKNDKLSEEETNENWLYYEDNALTIICWLVVPRIIPKSSMSIIC